MEGNSELPKPQPLTKERLRPEGQELGAMDSVPTYREKGIRNSEVAIKIVYNKHRSEEETKGLERLYKNTDVFIPEVFGWTPDYLENLQRLSNGDLTPDELLNLMGTIDPNERAKDESLFRLIHGKRKAIAIVDLPYEHPLWKRIVENKFPEIKFGPDFVRTLKSVREHNQEFASLQLEREDYMLEQVQQLTQNLKNIDSKLKKKENINVLMTIGSGHEQFPDKLRNHFQSVKEASITPRVYLYNEEASRKQMNGIHVNDELLIRVLAERVLSYDKNKTFTTNDPVRDASLIREYISRFSFDELKDMFEHASDQMEWASLFKQGFNNKLKVPAAAK